MMRFREVMHLREGCFIMHMGQRQGHENHVFRLLSRINAEVHLCRAISLFFAGVFPK
jgi:hypothetical protein